METHISNEQGRVPVTVFHIKGEIDTNSYEQLQAQAKQAFEAGTRNLLLDLRAVYYPYLFDSVERC